MRLAENTGRKNRQKSPSGHHRTILSGYIFATKATMDNRKKTVKQQYLLYMASQYGELGLLTAEIRWRVWGTPANLNQFRVLASLLHRRRSTEVNETLQNVWPSPGPVNYIHFWRLLPPDGTLLAAKFTLHSSLAFSYIGSVTAQHWSSGRQPNFVAWYKELNYGTFAEGATYIWLGGHHVEHRPTF